MRYVTHDFIDTLKAKAPMHDSIKAGYSDARRFVFPQHILKVSRHSGDKSYAEGYKLGQADTNFRFVAFFYRIFLGLKHGRANVPAKPASVIIKT